MPRSRNQQYAAAAESPFAALRGPCGIRITGKQRRTKQLTSTLRLEGPLQNPTHTRRGEDGVAHDRRTEPSRCLRTALWSYPCTRLDILRRAYLRNCTSTMN